MLREDYELTPPEVQDLSNLDAVTALFAKLGYDTNARLPQNTAAMGITNEDLRASIERIERLASNKDVYSSLEVYLFQVKSVTVATTRGIARAFRDRTGDYLLVLTDNYERLDFVLVDRSTQADLGMEQSPLPGLPVIRQARVQPRVLSVERRKPSPVAVRTLRRFSFTEGDTLAQFEKLRAAYEVAYWSEPHFNNRALFSDYYLTERLPASPEWKSLDEKTAQARAFRALRDVYYAPERPGDLDERVLTILGFKAVRARRTGDESASTEADYQLYATGGSEVEGTPMLALCLAYPWGRTLDGRDEARDPERGDANPGAVVVKLLDSGEAGWAIVTNGRIWRLYSATAHSRATNYYEIDLQDLLSQPASAQAEAFPYFWLLFRAAAFIPSGRRGDGGTAEEDAGVRRSFLDTLLAESERYARELEETLKRRVFEDVFPRFAEGFIVYARTQGTLPADIQHLPDEARNRALVPFFAGTLTFLYRLLFVLYAESRDLLPVREARGYAEHSLQRVKQEIAERAGSIADEAPGKIQRAYSESSTALYDRLQTLFQAIDHGSADLNVPVYNGGLFAGAPDEPDEPDEPDSSADARVARFLATLKIPDRQLALGIDRLSRDPDERTHALGFIDYKSLGVRQLGSIYEGLLEFKLRVAPERMAIVRGKKTEEIIPYAEAVSQGRKVITEGTGRERRERIILAGESYLENDKRERKASGSYYTPDYIVKYIVAHTVGPVLSERLEALRPRFREAQQVRRAEQQKRDALIRQRMQAKNPDEEAYLKTRGVSEAFFDIKTLDPAMGSGHFLVEAVDYITDRMAEFLTAFPWNPVVHELAKTRNEIVEEMERQGVTVNEARLTDLNLLKRHVLKRCIYGVDLNPMAVELAKVSLWLDCFTLGAPLSFLDHHMKVGNSLIGASVEEVEKALTRNLWGSQFAGLLSATEMMRRVGDLSDVTAQEVAASKDAYHRALDSLAPFKRLLDVWLSEYFGNRGAQKTVDNYAQAIVDDNYAAANEVDRQAIAAALSTAREKRFFHWELEFPEVFYGAHSRKENGGFDAVVGNPPYDELSEDDRGAEIDEMTYLQATPRLQPALGYRVNVYRLFIAQALYLTRRDGFHGYIVPLSLLADRFTYSLRKRILETAQIALIEQFPQKDDPNNRVFADAKLSTCVYIVSYRPPLQNRMIVRTHPGRSINEDSPTYVTEQSSFEYFDPENLSIPGLSQQAWNLVLGLVVVGRFTRFGSYADALPGELMINRQFAPYLTDSAHGEEIIRGSHVGMYEIVEPKQGESLYLNREKYLADHASGGKAEHFQSQRVVYQRYAAIDNYRRLISTVLPVGLFCSHTVGYLANVKAVKIEYLCSLLNTRLLDWRFNLTSTNNNINGYEVEGLPVRRIAFTTSEAERARYLDEGKQGYGAYLEAGDEGSTLAFVAERLAHEPEQSDVVHDLLAYLAEEMIRLNREKRDEQKRYLDGLVAALRVLPDREGHTGLDALTGKSKLADYPGDYQKGEAHLTFEGLLEILRKNRGRLGASLSDPALVQRLRGDYEASLTRILPLKERLARTDRLIDQIVYKLYGLTEDEIAIVEGR